MLNIGKLCLDTDFNFRVIREEDNDIDLFIDINYRSLDIDTNGDSFFNSRIQFPYVRSLILRINKESNIMTVHLMRDIDLFSAFANFEVNYDNCIINIKNDYINAVKDVKWDKYIAVDKYKDDDIKQELYDLFKRIDYQFIKSSRKKPYESYRKWFEEYCKLNFLRRRGSLGYTLNMTKERLLFITKLCIKDKEKIKLKDLFEEYKRRGIYFDRDSQSKIVDLFEKLNIIEKKSDSGDAQYVRSIL